MLAAIKNPLALDQNRVRGPADPVDSDRLGATRSAEPLATRKRGLRPAGVQSVAVRIVCEREEIIRNFKPEEYWTITAALEGANPPPFEAKLIKIGGKKAKVGNDAQAMGLVETLKKSAFTVSGIESKETKEKSAAPLHDEQAPAGSLAAGGTSRRRRP